MIYTSHLKKRENQSAFLAAAAPPHCSVHRLRVPFRDRDRKRLSGSVVLGFAITDPAVNIVHEQLESNLMCRGVRIAWEETWRSGRRRRRRRRW